MSKQVKLSEVRQEQYEGDSRTMLGFWIYIMTDCVLFASLFAVYAVLHGNTFGGPGGDKLFDSGSVLLETLALLTSSFTCGLAMLAAHKKQKQATLGWLAVTFVLGIVFLIIEIHEFVGLYSGGNSWQRSGFLSSFFVLVGTHGLHITIGLSWMAAMCYKIWRGGFRRATLRRLSMFSLFWHFLDIVWIFIFTVVYMMGLA